jgi:hypothetical protein
VPTPVCLHFSKSEKYDQINGIEGDGMERAIALCFDEQSRVSFDSELTAATTLLAVDPVLVYGQEEQLNALGTAANKL